MPHSLPGFPCLTRTMRRRLCVRSQKSRKYFGTPTRTTSRDRPTTNLPHSHSLWAAAPPRTLYFFQLGQKYSDPGGAAAQREWLCGKFVVGLSLLVVLVGVPKYFRDFCERTQSRLRMVMVKQGNPGSECGILVGMHFQAIRLYRSEEHT